MTNTMRWVLFMCLGFSMYLAAATLHTGANMLELAPVVGTYLMFGVGGESFAAWMKLKK